MPFSFPSAPTVGQQSTQNGRVYQWTGSAWELATAVASHTHTAADIVPTGTAGQVLKINAGATGVEWGQADVDVLHDTVSSTAYTGRAAPGSATSASVWKIRKTIYTSAGAVSSTGTATNVKWDDRLTASYS